MEYKNMQNETGTTSGSSREFSCDSGSVTIDQLIGHTWVYKRIDHEEREITFHRSGGITLRGGGLENRWRAIWEAGVFVLEIRDGHGEVTCRLSLDYDGVWRGRWEKFEKMSVELRRIVAPTHFVPGEPLSWPRFSEQDEQEFILRFFKGIETGTFLDIGGYDGYTSSNSRALYLSGWKGAIVEPVPEMFWKLSDLYEGCISVKLVNAAICDRDGYVKMWMRSGFSGFPDQRSTIDDETIRVVDCEPSSAISSFRLVRGMSIRTLLRIVGEVKYDFLSTDAEGVDDIIIRGLLNEGLRPRLIMWECDKDPGKVAALSKVLHHAGYSEVFRNAANSGWATE